jgi:hypothetical protein
MMPGTAGIPFSARYEQIVVEPLDGDYCVRQVRWGTIYRDRDGRIRNEVEKNMGEGNRTHTAEIYDPVGRCFYLLDLNANTLRSVRLPARKRSKEGYTRAAFNAADSAPIEDLGEREVEGITCRGKRIVRPDEVTESWYSGELRQVVLKETMKGEHWRQTYRLYSISLEEPEPSLFLVNNDAEST